jgi:hypothetical protein
MKKYLVTHSGIEPATFHFVAQCLNHRGITILWNHRRIYGARGGAVVEALRYNLGGRGFNSRWCHCSFSLTKSFRSHYGPGVDSASNRNEYQEYFLGGKSGRFVGLTTLPPSCADFLKIWEHQTSGTVRACQGL